MVCSRWNNLLKLHVFSCCVMSVRYQDMDGESGPNFVSRTVKNDNSLVDYRSTHSDKYCFIVYIHPFLCVSTLWTMKKVAVHLFVIITLENLDRFLYFLHCCKEEEIFHSCMKRCPPHLNIVLMLPSKNWTITFNTFVMLSENNIYRIKHGVKHKFIKYRENKLIVTRYVQNVCLWFKHKLASVLAIGQLHHQSATAPDCTTQLHDTCGLSLPVRNQVNQFRAPFLTVFIPLPFQFLSENSRISCRAP